MIIRPRPTAFGLLFILRGSILPIIAPRVLFVLAASILIVWLDHVAPQHFIQLTPAPFTLFGLALSIFLGFRNNACYERWWEARKQWGQLIAEIRGLLRDGMTLLPDEQVLRSRFAHRTIAFAHALRDQLRDTDGTTPRDWLPQVEWNEVGQYRNRAGGILQAQSNELGRLLREGDLSDILFQLLSSRLQVMADVQAACERLRSTPTPFTYSLLLHRTAWLFCLLLPFGLVQTMGMATPIATTILAYAFFGLDALGDDLEQPFSLSQNAIPLDAMVRAIEIAVLESLGEKDIPLTLQPHKFILS